MADQTEEEESKTEQQLVKVPGQLTEMDLHKHELSYFRGVAPNDPMNKMYGFAVGVCNCSFIPPAARGDAGAVFFMVSRSQELGLPWTQGITQLYPLKKKGEDGTDTIRLGMEGSAALALLFSKKFKCKVIHSDNQKAEWWIERPDGSMEFQDSFTIEEAEALGLTRKPNWKYPKDMLRWRALMRTGRIVGADVLGGLYLPEELESIDMEQNGQGTYTSARQQAEEAADKKAESDPNLEVVVGPASAKRGRGKPKETPVVEASAEEEGAPKINLPTGTTVEATPEFIEKFNELSPQEARNAAFLANQSKKEAPKPASTVTATPIGSAGGIKPGDVIPSGDPEKAAIRARMEAIRKAISPGYDLASVSQMIHAFYGDAGAKSTKQILIALDNIESALANEKVRSAFISICKENPVAAGKNLRTALDALPIFDKDEEPAKAEPSTATGDFIPGLNWGDDTVRFAREVMTKRKIDETKLVNVMRTYDVHEMPEGQASIWLLLYWFNSDSMLLAKRAKSKGKTAADVLDLIEAELKSQLTKESNPLAVERAITNAFTELSD